MQTKTIDRAFERRLRAGYRQLEAGNPAAACPIWLELWREILPLAERLGVTRVRDMERHFPASDFFANWVQDIEEALGNAAHDDPAFHETRLTYMREYLAQFAEERDLITENMRRFQAEILFVTGRREEAEELFRGWLDADPTWGWGWINWSDCWAEWGKDEKRAEEILRRGHAVEDLRDLGDLEERLSGLGADFEARADASRRVPRHFGDAGPAPEPFYPPVPDPVRSAKVGRNAPCPCGSGKKYKKCCGGR